MEIFYLDCSKNHLLFTNELLGEWSFSYRELTFTQLIQHINQVGKAPILFINKKIKNLWVGIQLIKQRTSDQYIVQDIYTGKMKGKRNVDRTRQELMDCVNITPKKILEYKIKEIVGRWYNIPLGIIYILFWSFWLNLCQMIVILFYSK